jgi:hypothetical protein
MDGKTQTLNVKVTFKKKGKLLTEATKWVAARCRLVGAEVT